MSVGIILCTHQGSRFLEEQLASIIAQDRLASVICISDWNSTDRTRSILDGFKTRWQSPERAIDITLNDEAPGPSISFTVSLCSALTAFPQVDYWFFCDQDDVWNNKKISMCLEKICVENLDFLAHDCRLIDEGGMVLSNSFIRTHKLFKVPDSLDLSVCFSNPFPGMCMVFSRHLALEFKKSSLIESESIVMHDWWLLIIAVSNNFRCGYLDLSLVDYRQHTSNILGFKNKVPRLSDAVSKILRSLTQLQAVDLGRGSRFLLFKAVWISSFAGFKLKAFMFFLWIVHSSGLFRVMLKRGRY